MFLVCVCVVSCVLSVVRCVVCCAWCVCCVLRVCVYVVAALAGALFIRRIYCGVTGATMEPLIIRYLQTRELAQGSIALVCRSWLQAHREHAWRFMVLTAGTAEDIHEDLHDDLDMSEAHATVNQFLSAPREVRERVALSAQSLTLKIAQLEKFLDDYEKWIALPFDRLKRLVIHGPNYGRHFKGLKICGSSGLRLGLVLSKVTHTVETLIITATLEGESDDDSESILATIVSMFSNLTRLDLPEAHYGLGSLSVFKVSRFLESCQGVAIDIDNFQESDKVLAIDIYNSQESWLAHVPRLKRLHLHICKRNERLSVFDALDCGPFFGFLANKCSDLEYLQIDFGDYNLILSPPFSFISTRMKWLVLSFDIPSLKDLEAQDICKDLRPWVPHSCKLFVSKFSWDFSVEDILRWGSNVEDFFRLQEHVVCA